MKIFIEIEIYKSVFYRLYILWRPQITRQSSVTQKNMSENTGTLGIHFPEAARYSFSFISVWLTRSPHVVLENRERLCRVSTVNCQGNHTAYQKKKKIQHQYSRWET